MVGKKGQTALDLAAKMVSLANVDGQLMVATPWGLRPNPKEAIQVYNQLYRQVWKSGHTHALITRPISIFALVLIAGIIALSSTHTLHPPALSTPLLPSQITEDDDWMRRRAPLDRKLAATIATTMLLPLFQLVASDELTGDAAQCYEYLLWNDMGTFLMSEAAEEVEEVRDATLSSIQEQIDAAWEATGSKTDTQLFLLNAKHPDRKPKPLGSLQEPVLPNRLVKTGALTHQIEALRFPIKSKGTFAKPILPTPLAFVTRLDAAAAVEACLSVGGITPVQYTAWLEQAPPSGSRFEYFWGQIMGFFLKGLGAMGDAALLAGLKPRLEAMVQVAAGGLPAGNPKAETETKTDAEGRVGAGTEMGEEDNNGDGDENESVNMETQMDNERDLDAEVSIGDDDESEHEHEQEPVDLSDDDQSDNDGADTTTTTTTATASTKGEDPAPRLVVWSPTDDANALWRIQHHKRQYREATVTAFGSALVQSYTQCRGVSSQVAISEPFHPFEQGGNLGISRAAVVSDSDEQLLLDRAMLVGLDVEKDGMQVRRARLWDGEMTHSSH